MQTVILYLSTAILFLGLDAAGLTTIIKPAFERQLGDWLLESPRYGPALVFYLFYVVGVLFFVSLPAIRNDTGLVTVFLTAALFGAVAYGTYEFSNLATLKNWAWSMVALDMVWGTLLTAVSATAGVAITRAFT